MRVILFFFFFLEGVVYLFIYLFIYLWLCWVFVSVQGLSLVAASGGHSSSRCAGLSLSRPLLLWSTGSRRAGSVVVAHGRSCSAACGIFPDQGSNPCPLHWQADSQPLRHQGSPRVILDLTKGFIIGSLWVVLSYNAVTIEVIHSFSRNRSIVYVTAHLFSEAMNQKTFSIIFQLKLSLNIILNISKLLLKSTPESPRINTIPLPLTTSPHYKTSVMGGKLYWLCTFLLQVNLHLHLLWLNLVSYITPLILLHHRQLPLTPWGGNPSFQPSPPLPF